jgi:predicted nucleic acid-binding protein
MTARTFVDTNIWVYANESQATGKRERAREVLSADPSALWTSAQVMGELYVTLTRKLTPPMEPGAARTIVGQLARLNVAPLEAGEVLAALDITRDGQVSYWDALIIAAARASGCERLLSGDLAAGSVIAGVRIESPFDDRPHRLAEPTTAYGHGRASWDDHALRDELARYETEARAAGMTPNAVHAYWDYARRFLDWRTGAYQPRGVPRGRRPVPDVPVSADDLEHQAAEYAHAIEAAGRGQSTIDTYHRHAMFLVRWLRGEFVPGRRLR